MEKGSPQLKVSYDKLEIEPGTPGYKVSGLTTTVNSEIFARILFSGIAFKDIFATLKMPD